MIHTYFRCLRYLLYSLFLFFSFISCSFFTDPVESEVYTTYPDLPRPGFFGTVAFIYDNDIYLFPESDKRPTRITFSPEASKRIISLNTNKDKLAYLDDKGIPTIMTVEGAILEQVPQADTVLDMGWVPNSETLYMLVNNRIEFHGPSLGIPQPVFLDPSVDLLSVSLSDQLDLAYVYISNNSNGRRYMGVDYRDPSRSDLNTRLATGFTYIRISPNGENLVYLSSSQIPDNWLTDGHVREGSGSFYVDSDFLRNAVSPVFMGNSHILYGNGTDEYPYISDEANVMINSLSLGNTRAANSYLSYFRAASREIFIDWKP